MPILNRDAFFAKLQKAVGNDTSEESLSLIEDMTDTYNDLEERANNAGNDWEKKYHDLNHSWQEKYKARFFSTGGKCNTPTIIYRDRAVDEEEAPDPADVRIDDLFK